jgi:hypothetical protein
MNFLIILWTLIVLFSIGGFATFGVGISKSDECVDRCKTGKKILIASNILYIIATILFTFGIKEKSTTLLVLSVFFFIIASVLIGVGGDRTEVCVDTCKTGMNYLVASNVLFLVAGLMTALHFSGTATKNISLDDSF